MISKQKLYSIALLSTAMILMLTSIAGAVPFAYVTNQNSGTVSVINTTTNNVYSYGACRKLA
jgi:type IV secretory pathway component VirB8